MAMMLTAAGLAVAACGVKSSPRHPEGSTYPQKYPTPLPPIEVRETEEKAPGPGQTAPSAPQAPAIYSYPNPPSYRPPKQ